MAHSSAARVPTRPPPKRPAFPQDGSRLQVNVSRLQRPGVNCEPLFPRSDPVDNRVSRGMTTMQTLKRVVSPLLLAMVLAGVGAGSVQAQESGIVTPNREASEFIHSLMSPYCPGLLLSDCKSQGAFVLRAEITERLAAGESRRSIEDDLVARFGPTIRTVPALEGIGLIVWLGPAVLGALGLAVAVRVIRGLTRRHCPTADDADQFAADTDGGLGERLREQLSALD